IHVLFFFSSRRRHTRSKRDWSSDVCFSDLAPPTNASAGYLVISRQVRSITADALAIAAGQVVALIYPLVSLPLLARALGAAALRSEERRVGKAQQELS